nr:cell envelope integrity protein TolA [uncultured Deefgea sp.]
MNPNRSNYPDEQRGLAFVLAIGMHALLAGFLLFSVQWKTKQPEPVVVELWGAPPPAPVASEQIEQPKPVKVRETKPEPIPVPVKAPDIVTEKVKATTVPTAKPTIKPTVAPTAKPTLAPTAKPTAAPSAKPTVAPKATQQPKKTITKAQQPVDDPFDLLGTSKGEKPSPNAKVGGNVGGTGDTLGATGGAGKGKGNGLAEGYKTAVGEDIKLKINYTKTGQKPRVVYTIFLLPSGEIRDIVKKTPSSDPKWDDAVYSAIKRFAPFPKPPNGLTFNDVREIELAFRPEE